MTHPKKIDPNKIYSLTEIVREQFIPGLKCYPAIRNRVLEDLALSPNKRTINAIKVGEGRGSKYLIKGRDILKFIGSL